MLDFGLTNSRIHDIIKLTNYLYSCEVRKMINSLKTVALFGCTLTSRYRQGLCASFNATCLCAHVYTFCVHLCSGYALACRCGWHLGLPGDREEASGVLAAQLEDLPGGYALPP